MRDTRHTRQDMLAHSSVEILVEMLASVTQPEKLLAAVFKETLFLVRAGRGLIFDGSRLISSAGYSGGEVQAARQRLAPLLMEGYVHLFSGPGFGRVAAAAPEAGFLGMAGVLAPPNGVLAVIGVERDTPFVESDIRRFREWLDLASIPAGAAMETAQAERGRRSQGMRLRDLPLDRLEEMPALSEIERLVIAEAMRRARNNKTAAAALLGMTREGLRKKMVRLAES